MPICPSANLTLALLLRIASAGMVDEARQREVVDRFIARLGIKTAGPEQKIRELSGGNQQVLARWLCMDPKLLMLDEADPRHRHEGRTRS